MQTIDSTPDTDIGHCVQAFLKALFFGGDTLPEDFVPQHGQVSLNVKRLPATEFGPGLTMQQLEPVVSRRVRQISAGHELSRPAAPPRLPQGGATTKLDRSVLGAVAKDVSAAVGMATLQHRENDTWLQLELSLWKAMTETVEKWRRASPR